MIVISDNHHKTAKNTFRLSQIWRVPLL